MPAPLGRARRGDGQVAAGDDDGEPARDEGMGDPGVPWPARLGFAPQADVAAGVDAVVGPSRARASIADATSTDHPLTRPEGSSVPDAQASK